MTATPGLHVGVNEKLYRNTGTYGSPVWSLINIATDVNILADKSMAEVKARLSTIVKNLPAMKTLGIEFTILGDTSVTDYDTLRDAYMNDTMIEFAVADQPIANSGCEYYRQQSYLSSFPIDQKLEDAQTAKVKADVAYTANDPSFVNVA
jgi:hypothetical protein